MKHLMCINELVDCKEIEKQLEFELEDYQDNLIKYILVGKSSIGYWIEFNINVPEEFTYNSYMMRDYIKSLINETLMPKMEKFCRKYNYKLLDIKKAATGQAQIHAQIKPIQ